MKALQFSEVYIEPQYSDIVSRSHVKTEVSLDKTWMLDVPVMSANMDTVTDGTMATAMFRAGAVGGIHRFMSIEENVAQIKKALSQEAKVFVSVGVNADSKERTEALYGAGARYFIVDIAHGHSKMMKDMVMWMREKYQEKIYIMAGNIATKRAMYDLVSWGVNAVKVGIGPGAVCTTKNVTGVTVPQFHAIGDVFKGEDGLPEEIFRNGQKILFVADGGVQEIGDIAKAIGNGADIVMCGKMFAGCAEAPGERLNGKKIYRGMASKDAMLTIREESALPTPEGISTLLDTSNEAAGDIVKRIKGGLQSSFSYSNAKNIREFQKNVKFGIRS